MSAAFATSPMQWGRASGRTGAGGGRKASGDGSAGAGEGGPRPYAVYPPDRPQPGLSRTAGEVFFFAEDFDLPAHANVPEPEVIEPSFSAAELESARAEGFQAGSAAAAEHAADAEQARIRQVLTAVAAQLNATRDELMQHAEQAAVTTARLLLGSLGVVLPELAGRYGEAELQAVIRVVLPGLFQEPAMTLRVNPCHAAAVTREIERHEPDLADRLQIVPTDTVPPGDARIAWRNGSAVRDAAALWAQVTEALGLVGLAPQQDATRELEHA